MNFCRNMLIPRVLQHKPCTCLTPKEFLQPQIPLPEQFPLASLPSVTDNGFYMDCALTGFINRVNISYRYFTKITGFLRFETFAVKFLQIVYLFLQIPKLH